MPYILTLAIILIVAAWLRTRLPAWRERRARSAEAAADLRLQVLSRAILGRISRDRSDRVRGAAMDWGHGGGLATLVALDDDTVSLYLNPGGGIIGAGSHANVAEVAGRFREEAARHQSSFKPTNVFSSPPPGAFRFYVLTTSATLASEVVYSADLGDAHSLRPLNDAAQQLITAVLRAPSRRMQYRPPAQASS